MVECVCHRDSFSTGQAWIGLYDELIDSWKWSLDDSVVGTALSGFDNCVEMPGNSSNVLVVEDCSLELPFICYNGKFNDM